MYEYVPGNLQYWIERKKLVVNAVVAAVLADCGLEKRRFFEIKSGSYGLITPEYLSSFAKALEVEESDLTVNRNIVYLIDLPLHIATYLTQENVSSYDFATQANLSEAMINRIQSTASLTNSNEKRDANHRIMRTLTNNELRTLEGIMGINIVKPRGKLSPLTVEVNARRDRKRSTHPSSESSGQTFGPAYAGVGMSFKRQHLSTQSYNTHTTTNLPEESQGLDAHGLPDPHDSLHETPPLQSAYVDEIARLREERAIQNEKMRQLSEQMQQINHWIAGQHTDPSHLSQPPYLTPASSQQQYSSQVNQREPLFDNYGNFMGHAAEQSHAESLSPYSREPLYTTASQSPLGWRPLHAGFFSSHRPCIPEPLHRSSSSTSSTSTFSASALFPQGRPVQPSPMPTSDGQSPAQQSLSTTSNQSTGSHSGLLGFKYS